MKNLTKDFNNRVRELEKEKNERIKKIAQKIINGNRKHFSKLIYAMDLIVNRYLHKVGELSEELLTSKDLIVLAEPDDNRDEQQKKLRIINISRDSIRTYGNGSDNSLFQLLNRTKTKTWRVVKVLDVQEHDPNTGPFRVEETKE